MYLITLLFQWLFNPVAFILYISLVIYYLVNFYVKVFSFPPGPIPLPIIGSILSFRSYKRHWNLEIFKLYKRYGPVFTLWIGPTPLVFVNDLDLAKETFSKSEFSGRPDTFFGNCFNNDDHKDIVFNDYGRSWESLRRVAHIAIRNYAKTDELSHVVSDCVEQTVRIIKANQTIDKPFVPKVYIYNIFANIIGSSIFSQRFNIEDQQLSKYKYLSTDFMVELGNRLFLWEFVPIIRYFIKDPLQKYRQILEEMGTYATNIYESHKESYDTENRRDFCDILINAKIEAINKEKEYAPYLTDTDLPFVLNDLFLAGTETSQTTLQWIMLYLAYYPECQKRLKAEISHEIGNRMPIQADKNKLDYVLAFISEILRIRNPLPIGVFHKAVVTSKIGTFIIPKGTRVINNQYCIMMDDKHWINPEQFKPERFLNKDGKYLDEKPGAFVPFSIGRRICPGEKLAMADLFLVLVRFLQLTSEYDIALDDPKSEEDTLDPDPVFLWIQFPKNFKITLKKAI